MVKIKRLGAEAIGRNGQSAGFKGWRLALKG
jgi:hypothetical protein